VQHAVRIDAPEVAGEILPTARIARIGGKSHRIELGTAPITGTDVRATDDNFTRVAGVCRVVIVASDLDPHTLGTSTDWNDRSGGARAAVLDYVLRDQSDLGRSKLVDENAPLLRVRADEIDVA